MKLTAPSFIQVMDLLKSQVFVVAIQKSKLHRVAKSQELTIEYPIHT